MFTETQNKKIMECEQKMFKRKQGRPKKEEIVIDTTPEVMHAVEEGTPIPPPPMPEVTAEEKEYISAVQEFANTIPNLSMPMPSAVLWMEVREMNKKFDQLILLMKKATEQE